MCKNWLQFHNIRHAQSAWLAPQSWNRLQKNKMKTHPPCLENVQTQDLLSDKVIPGLSLPALLSVITGFGGLATKKQKIHRHDPLWRTPTHISHHVHDSGLPQVCRQGGLIAGSGRGDLDRKWRSCPDERQAKFVIAVFPPINLWSNQAALPGLTSFTKGKREFWGRKRQPSVSQALLKRTGLGLRGPWDRESRSIDTHGFSSGNWRLRPAHGGNVIFCHVSRNQMHFLSTLYATFALDRRQVTLAQRKLPCKAKKRGCWVWKTPTWALEKVRLQSCDMEKSWSAASGGLEGKLRREKRDFFF